MTRPLLPDVCDNVLLEEDVIADRVRELGADIEKRHAGEDLRLITVLRGGLFFLADLARAIQAPLAIDFLGIVPYHPDHGGVARLTKDLSDDIAGSSVVLVEDIVDTGLTVHYISRLLRAHGPGSFEICALLDKPARRIAEVPVDYTGFEMPDKFLVGYGLDLAGKYRNLPYVASLSEDVYQ